MTQTARILSSVCRSTGYRHSIQQSYVERLQIRLQLAQPRRRKEILKVENNIICGVHCVPFLHVYQSYRYGHDINLISYQRIFWRLRCRTHWGNESIWWRLSLPSSQSTWLPSPSFWASLRGWCNDQLSPISQTRARPSGLRGSSSLLRYKAQLYCYWTCPKSIWLLDWSSFVFQE